MENVRFPNIAKAMSQLLESCDWNKAEVARLLHTSATNVFHWATGEREPSLNNLMKIAKAVNKTPGYLIGDNYCVMMESLPQEVREYHRNRVMEDFIRYCQQPSDKRDVFEIERRRS